MPAPLRSAYAIEKCVCCFQVCALIIFHHGEGLLPQKVKAEVGQAEFSLSFLLFEDVEVDQAKAKRAKDKKKY